MSWPPHRVLHAAHASVYWAGASGHDVRLFDFEQFDTTIAAIRQAGGLHSEGDLIRMCPTLRHTQGTPPSRSLCDHSLRACSGFPIRGAG